MGKISNYLEMIEDIKNKTPEKEAFLYRKQFSCIQGTVSSG